MQTVESTMIIQFDKHRFIKGLSRDNLYTAEQAERMAEELDGALSQSQRMLATKDDLREVNTKLTKLESDIAQVSTKLESDIAQVHTEMKAMEYRLEALITKSQKQLMVLVPSMMVGFITILPYLQKLLHF